MSSRAPTPTPSTGPQRRPAPTSAADLDARQLDANIERTAQANNTSFRTAMERFREQIAVTRNDVEQRRARGEQVRDPYEGITEQMLQDINREYAATTDRLKVDIRNLYQNSPNGAPPDSRWLQRNINTLNQEHTTEFNRRIHERYGAQGDKILQAVSGHTERPGIMDKFLSRLGTPGGIIGAIGLGAAAFLGMGGMNGGFMAMIAGVLAAAAGGAVGGSINNAITGADSTRVQPAPPIPDINAPGQNRGPEPSQAQTMVPGNLTPAAVPAVSSPPQARSVQ